MSRATYRLLRHRGVLVFNAFADRERYWASVLAAAIGGGPMYAEIGAERFEDIFAGRESALELEALFHRSWSPSRETATAEAYRLEEAVAVHRLHSDMGPEPVRSVVEAQIGLGGRTSDAP